MKILLAVDGSAHNKAVVDKIAGRLFSRGTKIHIVSVYERTPRIPSEEFDVPQEYYTKANQAALKATENVAEYAAKLLRRKNPTLTISKAAIEGSPKTVILHEAETTGADLIIVGSHGYGFVKRFFLGSVSQAVTLHAKCSVEIVRIKNINSKVKTQKTRK